MTIKIEEINKTDNLTFKNDMKIYDFTEISNHPSARTHSYIRFYSFREDNTSSILTNCLKRRTDSEVNLKQIFHFVGNELSDRTFKGVWFDLNSTKFYVIFLNNFTTVCSIYDKPFEKCKKFEIIGRVKTT